jgi:hypothetical protein
MFAAQSIQGTGKLFFIGHNTFFGISRWTETASNAVLFDNIFNWFGPKATFKIGNFGGTFNKESLISILGLAEGSITIDDLTNQDLDVVDL